MKAFFLHCVNKKSIFSFSALIAFCVLNITFPSKLSAYTIEDLELAMETNSPELRKLEEEYKQSLLDVKDAKAGLGPTVDLQMSGTYMLNPPVGPVYLSVDDILNSISWPAGISPSSAGQYLKIYDGMESTLYNFNLSVTQPVFTWGKLIDAVKLYKDVSEIKKLQLESQEKQMRTELKTRLISLYYLERILEFLEEEKLYAARLVETSENAEKSGMLLVQDVVEAKIQAKELEIAQRDVLEQIQNQLLELERMTGLQNLEISLLDYEFYENETLSVMNLDRHQAEEMALSGNQQSIKMLEKLKDVNVAAGKIAKASVNWKPDVALQASASYGGPRFPFFEPNWYRKDDYSINISLGLKVTVWDGGKKLNDVSRKISETRVADINKIDARTSIKKNLSSQWNALDVCLMKIDYQKLKIESADAKIKQQENMYSSGYGSESDVLSAKIAKCNEQIEKERLSLNLAVACMTISYLCY